MPIIDRHVISNKFLYFKHKQIIKNLVHIKAPKYDGLPAKKPTFFGRCFVNYQINVGVFKLENYNAHY